MTGSNGSTLVTIGDASPTEVQYSSTDPTTPLSGWGAISQSTSSSIKGPTSGTSPQYAFAANPKSSYSTAIAGTEWITPYIANGTHQPTGGNSNFTVPTGYYLFSTVFTLAPGQTAFISGTYYSHNHPVDIWVAPTTKSSGFSALSFTTNDPTDSTLNTFSGKVTGSGSGSETLYFVLKDTGGDVSLDFSGTAVPEPTTIVAFVIAFLGLGILMLRGRKASHPVTAI